MKFRQLATTLTNTHINIALRLKLFGAVVSPTLCYSLDTCALTLAQPDMVDAIQRKMMRRMIGWQIFDEDGWEDVGRRMKQKLTQALERQPIVEWSKSIANRKQQLLTSQDSLPVLTKKAMMWNVVECASLNNVQGQSFPKRSVGHPRTRWREFEFVCS